MAGTKQGAAKAAQTNKDKYGPDFYREIGSQSWKNPERSRTTGFALLPKEQVVELGRKGGQQNKGKTYVKKQKIDSAAVYTKGDGSKVGDRFTLQGEEFEVALVEEFTTADEIRALLEEDKTSDSSDLSE